MCIRRLSFNMADFYSDTLLETDAVAIWDVVCPGTCNLEADEECAESTHFVFPYRGLYVRHVGRTQSVAEPNQLVVFNENEPYRVSHPVAGGDACLSIGVAASTLLELTPPELLRGRDRAGLNRSLIRVDAHAQAHAAALRHRLRAGVTSVLEAEILTLELLRRALGRPKFYGANVTPRTRRLVDFAKVVIAADLGRRRTLAEIAAEVGVSPVYLTQVFQRVDGIPLYRYQLQLRLARALQLLNEYDDMTELAFALGFSSHSHFSASFKQAYGLTPSAFRQPSR
jgi:AraC family transcriptional regulator